MKNYLKRKFAVGESGAKGLTRSITYCFLTYVLQMFPVMLMMFFLDGLFKNEIQKPFVYILISLIIMGVLYIVLGLEYDSMFSTTYREAANLRIRIAEKLKNLPLAYFSKHNLSDLSQTIMSDVEGIEHSMSHAIPKVFGFYIFFILLSILMLNGNMILGLAVILPFLLSLLFLYLSKMVQIRGHRKYYERLRKNSESFQEAIELHQEIESFNLQDDIKEELYRTMENSEELHVKENNKSILIIGISSLLSFLSIGIVVLTGSILLRKGEITLIYLIGYVLSAIKLKELLDYIEEVISEFFYLDPKVTRINEIQNHEIQEGTDYEFKNFDIEFKDVTFSYNEDTPVLKNVNFLAKQGHVTALCGVSGCGKTSILRLVSRLYDYTSGKILIDGKDISTVSTESLFKKISMVFQDVTLFNSSVLENIRIGRRDASDTEVKKAAELAGCMEFIEKLENGFNTPIGENGAKLSGGERQRISIARAFLKDAPILLLDEISASLDINNEREIQRSLNKLIKNKTVIIISHRLKAIENVDKIIVIDKGRVECEGTHEHLLENSKVYKNLIEKSKAAEEFIY